MSDDKDVLDPALRLRFAWRTAATLPDDPLAPPPPAVPPPAEVPARTEPDLDRRNEFSPEACEELARRVARAWNMKPRTRQAAATHRLLAPLEPTTVGFTGMERHPVEVMRLWRLGVRHARVLSKHSRRVLWSMPLILDEHEVLEFLVEVVESGEDELVALLEKAGVPNLVARRFPALSARLVRVIEHGGTWAARERAVRWLVRTDRRAAVEPLRRAIRTPLLRLRACALNSLREASPTALTADDVAWLLDDAVKHPLPRGIDEDARTAYETALIEAVKACPPPEGWRPLTILANSDDLVRGALRVGLGRAWALAALAAGWPERAAARIDESLTDSSALQRIAAVEAAALLPEALSRPRLLEAAALPDHAAAELAKDHWFRRFGEACPVEPLAGVPVELLDAPASEALLARLTVLRGSSVAAAGKVLGAALAEAPAREALVLLLYSLRCIGKAHEQASLEDFEALAFVAKLFRGKEVWANALLRRFGAPAFDGLLALAARGAHAESARTWLGGLTTLARKGGLDEAQRERLRDLAAGLLSHEKERVVSMACEVLAETGAPASSIERLWSLALRPIPADDGDGGSRIAIGAICALAGSRDLAGIDARFVQEAEAALDRGAWTTLECLVREGWQRGNEGVLALAERALAAAEREPAAAAIAETCVRALAQARRLRGSKWLAATLARPSSLLFPVAAEADRIRAEARALRCPAAGARRRRP
ncbi:MAG: hypothetical protein QM820_46225 [Minicystis sp.]